MSPVSFACDGYDAYSSCRGSEGPKRVAVTVPMAAAAGARSYNLITKHLRSVVHTHE